MEHSEDPVPVWDMDEEKYEDFLERMPEIVRQGLADGTAFMAKPVDGFKLMQVFIESADENDELAAWLKMVSEIESEDECKQKITDIMALEIVASSMAKSISDRKHEIHKLTCETCRAAGGAPSKGQVKRALDAARQAFMEAIEADPEPWKGDEA